MTDDWRPTYEERMALAAKPDALADWRVERQAAAVMHSTFTLPFRQVAISGFGMESDQHQLFIEDCAR